MVVLNTRIWRMTIASQTSRSHDHRVDQKNVIMCPIFLASAITSQCLHLTDQLCSRSHVCCDIVHLWNYLQVSDFNLKDYWRSATYIYPRFPVAAVSWFELDFSVQAMDGIESAKIMMAGRSRSVPKADSPSLHGWVLLFVLERLESPDLAICSTICKDWWVSCWLKLDSGCPSPNSLIGLDTPCCRMWKEQLEMKFAGCCQYDVMSCDVTRISSFKIMPVSLFFIPPDC